MLAIVVTETPSNASPLSGPWTVAWASCDYCHDCRVTRLCGRNRSSREYDLLISFLKKKGCSSHSSNFLLAERAASKPLSSIWEQGFCGVKEWRVTEFSFCFGELYKHTYVCPQRKNNTKPEAMILRWMWGWESRVPTWAVRHFCPLFSSLWIVFICLFYLGWWDPPQSLARARKHYPWATS